MLPQVDIPADLLCNMRATAKFNVQPKSATLLNNRELRSLQMVEAAGIEPASEISPTKTSTCVVGSLIFSSSPLPTDKATD